MRENEILSHYDGISLEEMDDVKLMNRIDSKYIIKRNQLQQILAIIARDYFVLDIQGVRSFPYISLYYDTVDNRMYLAHHNGRTDRYKVRFRKYVTSNDTFLEIKHKVKGSLTLKKRIEVNDIEESLTPGSLKYIVKNTCFTGSFEPKMYTNFDRITLVNKNFTERVTIDRNLQFIADGTQCPRIENSSIIEVKRDYRAKRTQLVDLLRLHHIQPSGMSKYCIGRAILEPALKSNNFKDKILTLKKFENVRTDY